MSVKHGPIAVPAAQPQPMVIRAARGWRSLRLGEIWQYRELMWFLACRDIKVRYKQTLFGAAWAVLVPFLTMVVFNVLFTILLTRKNMPTATGIPYAISTYCAMVPWYLFSHSLSSAGNSLVANRALITKVYFPRLITPVAPVLAALVDFVIAFVVLIGMIAFYHFTDFSQAKGEEYLFHFGWQLCLLPVFVVMAVMTALSVALWLSALNAIYRDVKYILPFMIQMWMFISPVVYSTSSNKFAGLFKKQPWLETAYGLNPIAGVVEGFRWTLLGSEAPPVRLMIASGAMVTVLLIGGAFFFKRKEQTFIDLV